MIMMTSHARDDQMQHKKNPEERRKLIEGLEEVIGLRLFARHASRFLWCGLEYSEVALKVFVEFEYGSNIAAAVAVIGCTPDR